MNERIRKLAEQATKHYPATESSGEFSTFDEAMFAELIVRECVKIVEPSSYFRAYPENYKGGLDSLEILDDRVSKIKEHFGIQD